jgi:hypothetical protein
MEKPKGFILPTILLVFFVIGTLIVSYYWMFRNVRMVAFRMEKEASCRYLCEAAMDEAFWRIYQNSRSPGTPEFMWFIDHPTTPLTLNTPAITRESARIFSGNIVPKISASAQMCDFRNYDSKKNPYYGKEGVGSVQIAVHVELAGADGAMKQQATFNLLRRYDFKVVSMISARNNSVPRGSYCHNFPLDYALFVRRGEEEFKAMQGELINSERVQITLAQSHLSAEHRGKIFFGGTAAGSTDRFVFLNTSDLDKGVLPTLTKPEVHRINSDQALSLFPAIQKQFKDEDVSLDQLKGLEGVFVASILPLVAAPTAGGKLGQIEEYTRNVLLNSGLGPEANRSAGTELIERSQCGTPGYAASLFEGSVRQRFFYFVYFFLDASKLDAKMAAELQKEEYRLACLPMPSPAPSDQVFKDFLQNLQALPGAQGTPANPSPFISRLESGFLYSPQLVCPTGRLTPDSFGKPVFFDKTGATVIESSESFQAWNHVNLMNRRMLSETTLRELGIIDEKNKVLRLNGCEWIAGDITIGNPGEEYTVSGKGVLLANGNIRIGASLRKSGPEDIAVFFTRRGTITVEGTTVEASLIAMGGGSSSLIFQRPTVVKGAIIADALNTNSWAPGAYRFEYDPILKGNVDHYVVNLSTSHSFQRLLEGGI